MLSESVLTGVLLLSNLRCHEKVEYVWDRGLSSNGAENWDRASSLLDRPLRPPNDHGVFPRIIFCNHLFLRTFMHPQPQTTREARPYVIPLRRCESTDV